MWQVQGPASCMTNMLLTCLFAAAFWSAQLRSSRSATLQSFTGVSVCTPFNVRPLLWLRNVYVHQPV